MSETLDPRLIFSQFRRWYSTKSTISELFANGEHIGYILEDPVRGKKIKHHTAIPEGTYKLEMTHSNRFKRKTPQLLRVPNFTGIRIHPGNTPEDTSGCPLPGLIRRRDSVHCSRIAMAKIQELIDEADRAKTPIYWCISDLPIGD